MASKGTERRQLHACVAGKGLGSHQLVEKLQELRKKRAGAVLDTKASFTAAVRRIRSVEADGDVRDGRVQSKLVSLLLKFMPQEFDARMMGYVRDTKYVPSICDMLEQNVANERKVDGEYSLVHDLLQALRDVFDSEGGREHALPYALPCLVRISLHSNDVMTRRDAVDTLLHQLSCCRMAKSHFLSLKKWESTCGRLFTEVLPHCGDLTTQMHLFEILICTVKSTSHQGLALLPPGSVSTMFERFKHQWASKKMKGDQLQQALKKLALHYNNELPVTNRKVHTCKAVVEFVRLDAAVDTPKAITSLCFHWVDFGPSHMCLYSTESELGITPVAEEEGTGDVECSIYVHYSKISKVEVDESRRTVLFRLGSALTVYPGDAKVPEHVFDHRDPGQHLAVRLGKQDLALFESHILNSMLSCTSRATVPQKEGVEPLAHEKHSSTCVLVIPPYKRDQWIAGRSKLEFRSTAERHGQDIGTNQILRVKKEMQTSSQDCETKCILPVWSDNSENRNTTTTLEPKPQHRQNTLEHDFSRPDPGRKVPSQGAPLHVQRTDEQRKSNASKKHKRSVKIEVEPPTIAVEGTRQNKANKLPSKVKPEKTHKEIENTHAVKSLQQKKASHEKNKRKRMANQEDKVAKIVQENLENLRILDEALAISIQTKEEPVEYVQISDVENQSMPKEGDFQLTHSGDTQGYVSSFAVTLSENVSASQGTRERHMSAPASPVILGKARKRLFAEPETPSPSTEEPSPKMQKAAKYHGEGGLGKVKDRKCKGSEPPVPEKLLDTLQELSDTEVAHSLDNGKGFLGEASQGDSATFFKEFMEEHRRTVDAEIHMLLNDASGFIDAVLKKLESFSSTHAKQQKRWMESMIDVHAKKLTEKATSVKQAKKAMQAELLRHITEYKALAKGIPALQNETVSKVQKLEEKHGKTLRAIERQARGRLSYYDRKIELAKAEQKLLIH